VLPWEQAIFTKYTRSLEYKTNPMTADKSVTTPSSDSTTIPAGSEWLKALTAEFPRLDVKTDFPLASRTYFKIGGPAEGYVEISDENLVCDLQRWCKQHSITLTVLGGASNVVVSDQGIKGLVIHLKNDYCYLDEQTDEIIAGAGCKTALLVSTSVKLGKGGLEYFLGVPGTVGGAIYNNAHYLQDLIGEHVSRVKIVTAQGEMEWISQADCQFEYDSSRFHSTNEIIIAAAFALPAGDAAHSQALITKATQYRATTQPLGTPNSGCIFQNVPNSAALREQFPDKATQSYLGGGFLIDQAGLKGTKIGGISVSTKHAAFFVNDGTGTAQDVKKLIKVIKERVKAKFGVDLEEEVFILH